VVFHERLLARLVPLAGHSSVTVRQPRVRRTSQAMADAVFRLDRMNVRSLESEAKGDERSTMTQAPLASVRPIDTLTDAGRLLHPKVLEGRVAQLAEQLTLNLL